MFDPFELKNIKGLYDNKTLVDIVESFKYHCSFIVNENDLMTEQLFSERDFPFEGKDSIALINEKVVELKRTEFSTANLAEIAKHYLCVQENVVTLLFKQLNYEDFETKGNDTKGVLEVMNRVINILEEFLLHKQYDISLDCLMIRKVLVKLIKNQKAIIVMALEQL